MGDLGKAAAVEIGDGRAGAAPGADGSAVSAEAADAGLHVNGQQVAESDGPEHGLVAHLQFLGVLNDGHRGGDALVAAAGDDDDRHLAAAHAGVGPGGGHGPGANLDVVPVVLAQHLADVGAPVVGHALLGNGVVVVDLPLNDVLHILDVAGVHKVHNGLHGQAAPVRQAAGAVGDHVAALQQDLAVFLDQDDVGVVVRNAQADGVRSGNKGDDDIKDHVPRGRGHPDFMTGEIGLDLLLLGVGHLGDDLQDLSGVPGHRARGGRGLDALEAAGVGYHYAFNILDDIAAGLHQNALRQAAQNLPGLGGGVGDGNGLGAAHGGYQLLPQDLYKMVIALVGFLHSFPPFQRLPPTREGRRFTDMVAFGKIVVKGAEWPVRFQRLGGRGWTKKAARTGRGDSGG